MPCQLHVGDGYLVRHWEGAYPEWDRVKGGLERLPQLCTVLLAPCSKAESPATIPAARRGGFPQPPGCAGDGWRRDLQFTAQLCLLQHPGTDGGPISAPPGRAAGTLHPCLPSGSRALSPTAGDLLAPCPSGATLLAVLSTDRSQSCLYLFKSHLASIGLKNPMTTLLHNFV